MKEGVYMMTALMTWEQIISNFPNQRIAISNITWKDREHGIVDRACVVASEKDGATKREIASMAAMSNGSIIAENTNTQTDAVAGICTIC